MVFNFGDLERIIDDGMFDGSHLDWFREIWRIIERRGENKCAGRFEIIRFYRLVYQLCALYFGFTNVWNGSAPDEFMIYLDVDYSPLITPDDLDGSENDDELKDYIMSLITEEGFSEVRELFSDIDISIVFASLYYSINYETFQFEDNDTVLDEILNEVDADKMSAYDWLREELGK